MILILSSPDDRTTNGIIDWLRFYEYSFLRISDSDVIEYDGLVINQNEFDIYLKINGECYKLSDFKSFWYRRSHFNVFRDKILGDSNISKQINTHLSLEINELHKIFKKYISDIKPVLGKGTNG